MKRIAIRGHRENGLNVISLLESIGGRNETKWRGDREDLYYFINKYDVIDVCTEPSYVKGIEFTLYTLEEIEKLFPYKVGDKVIYKTSFGFLEDTVDKLYSAGEKIQYFLKSNSGQLVNSEDLQYRLSTSITCPKEIMEEMKIQTSQPSEYEKIIFLPDAPKKTELVLGDDFEIINEDGKILVVRKKTSIFPKDYEKCYDILYPTRGCDREIQEKLIYQRALSALDKLIICRNSYWMLDDNWKPDWKDNYQKKYTIAIYQDEISKTSGANVNRIFAFSSAEIRDDFYENFKDLFETIRILFK